MPNFNFRRSLYSEEIAPQWRLRAREDFYTYTNIEGALNITARGSLADPYQLGTITGFSLYQSAIEMHLPSLLEVNTTLLLYRDDANFIQVTGHPDGVATAKLMVDGISQIGGPVSLQSDLLRIEEVEGALLVQTGRDANGIILNSTSLFDLNGLSPHIIGELAPGETVVVSGINSE